MTPNPSKKALLSAASALAVLCAVPLGATRWVEHRVARSFVEAGASIGAVEADLLTGRITLRDIGAPVGGGYARIGSTTVNSSFGLVAPALAAENVTLNDVSFDFSMGSGKISYRLPRVEVTGSSLDRQQILGLFDRNASEPLSKRLAAFSASSVISPEVVVDQTIEALGAKQTVVYRNWALRDIKAGAIATMSMDGATVKRISAGISFEGTFGKMSVNDIDAVLMVRFYKEKAEPNEKEPRPLYSGFSLEKIAIAADKGVTVGIEKMSAGPVKVRPGDTPWLDVFGSMMEMKDFDKATPAERVRFGKAMVDIFDSFEFSGAEVIGTTIEAPAADKPVKVKIGRIGFSGGSKPEMRLEGFDIAAPDVRIQLGLMSFEGFSFKPTLEGLKELLAQPDMKPDNIDPRKFIPVFGTTRFADLLADVPNEKVPNQRIKMSLKGMEFTADKPFNGIPTNVRYAVNDFTFVIPPGSQEEGLKDLLDLGYKSIDISTALETTWNEAGSELAIKEISFNGVDMGTLAFRAVLGNVTKDVFSSDPTMAQVAAMGATAKSLSLSIENKGGFERGIALAAKQQGRTPDDLRKEVGLTATIAVPAVLGDSAGAKAIAAAVAKFVTQPRKLDISLASKDKAGLGLADFMAAAGNPAALFNKLDVSANAQ